jgi:hypothetical protein
MRLAFLIIVASMCYLLTGPGGSLAPSSAAAADSVQRAAMMMDDFMCDSLLNEYFRSLIREDKEIRQKTKKESPAWAKARKDARGYLKNAGIEVPDEIEVTFQYSIQASGIGVYCVEACIGSRGGRCASCAHPEKTGCLSVRHCYPITSL